jgi:transposase
MSKVRGKYTAEFKRQAVVMLVERGLRVARVARKLGVSESRLHEWKKQSRLLGSAAFPGSGHLTPIEEENRRLKGDRSSTKQTRPPDASGPVTHPCGYQTDTGPKPRRSRRSPPTHVRRRTPCWTLPR